MGAANPKRLKNTGFDRFIKNKYFIFKGANDPIFHDGTKESTKHSHFCEFFQCQGKH